MPAYRESAILAPDGRPILIAQQSSAYRASGTGRRFVGLHAPTRLGPNAALLPELEVLRARSRALARDNALVAGGLEKLVANLVGWGFTPESQHERKTARAKIDALWRDWATQVKLDALQKRAAREQMVAGEVFLRIRPRRVTDRDPLGRRLVVPLELQLLEAEHCPTWEDRSLGDGGFIRGGIQFDAIGRRVGYWLFPQHPGDGAPFRRARDLETRFVPASEIVHLYDPESPEQIRGTPRLARCLLTAHDLDAFHDATLQRQAIASLFAGFIRRPDGSTGLLNETPAAPEPTLEPGTLSYLAEGEDIVFPDTPDVGSNYQAFVKAMHLLLSLGVGVTYEQLSNDLSGVNYSSIRAGAIEFRRLVQVWQHTTFVPDFLTPIWVHFLRRAHLAGMLNVPTLLENEVAAGRVEWTAMGWDWVDPLKEVQAAIAEVQAGFETRRGVNRRRGNDPLRIELERAEEVAAAQQRALSYSSDAPATAPAASGPSPAPAEDGEEDAPPQRAAGGRRG